MKHERVLLLIEIGKTILLFTLDMEIITMKPLQMLSIFADSFMVIAL
jgi:hypothetical protein